MVESNLRVVSLDTKKSNNPFYGNTIVKKVTEETFIHDFDKREIVAPCGIIATIKVGDSVFDIKINKYYFDHESENEFVADFQFDERMYEVWVEFDGAHLINITLSEWLHCGDFEDGDDADNVYRKFDFTTIETFL